VAAFVAIGAFVPIWFLVVLIGIKEMALLFLLAIVAFVGYTLGAIRGDDQELPAVWRSWMPSSVIIRVHSTLWPLAGDGLGDGMAHSIGGSAYERAPSRAAQDAASIALRWADP
jgi:hypothetical protein